jgi:hypothetical protein
MTQASLSADGGTLSVRIPVTLQPRGGRKKIIAPDGQLVVAAPVVTGLDNPLIRALARAHRWSRMLETGAFATIGDLAAAEKVNPSYLCRMLRLTLLPPRLVEAIAAGRAERDLTVEELLSRAAG